MPPEYEQNGRQVDIQVSSHNGRQVDIQVSSHNGENVITKWISVTAVLAAYTPILVYAPILTDSPRTAASYSLGAVGKRLGQRDAHEAYSGGPEEANLAVPRRAHGSSNIP